MKKNLKYEVYIETESDIDPEAEMKAKILEAKLDDIARWITTLMVLLAGVYVVLNIFINYVNGFINKTEFLVTVIIITILLIAKLALSIEISMIKKELIKNKAL